MERGRKKKEKEENGKEEEKLSKDGGTCN